MDNKSLIHCLLLACIALSMASCSHRGRGVRAMTHEDSVRRAADRALDVYIADMEKVRDTLTGPTQPPTSSGEVTRGSKFKTNIQDDSMTSVTNSFEKLNGKIQRAQKDSTTPMGRLLSRFKLLDSEHKYLAGTYSSTGHLLTFHSEITKDDKHELDYDFYFDKGVLKYFRERRTYTADEDEQDMLSDDSYFVAGDKVLYAYRDEGLAQARRDRMDLMHTTRYALRGDLAGHVAHAYASFLMDYDILLPTPMEPMVYTPAVRVPPPVEVAPQKQPVRGNTL